MLTTGTKLLFGLAMAALVAAWVYGLSTGGDPVGVLSAGIKGGVGERLGYTILGSVALLAGFLGCVVAAFRDADPEAQAAVVGVEVPPATPPAGASAWPVVGAFGVLLAAIGLVVGAPLFLAGVGVVAITLIEWMVQAWADRATGDPEVNRTLRNRVMMPIEIPAIAVLAIGALVLGVSRVFIALSAVGATVAAIAVASMILLVASLLAVRPRVGANLVAALAVGGGLAVAVGGIVGAAVGPHEVDHHEGEVTDDGGAGEVQPEDEGGLGVPSGTVVVLH
ncbi:MAG TPA: hypothetical protein VF640_02770 [Acidimicrobiales bacterium]